MIWKTGRDKKSSTREGFDAIDADRVQQHANKGNGEGSTSTVCSVEWIARERESDWAQRDKLFERLLIVGSHIQRIVLATVEATVPQ